MLRDLERKQLEIQRQELLAGKVLQPGDDGYDPYDDFGDENAIKESMDDFALLEAMTRAVAGKHKKNEVRDVVGKILKGTIREEEEEVDDDADDDDNDDEGNGYNNNDDA